MTEHEANEIFNQIVGAEDNADLAEVKAPETDVRKDGIYYHATVTETDGLQDWDVAVYEVVADHRVVAHVQVSSNATVEPSTAGLPGLAAALAPGGTVHAIEISTPDGSVVLPTGGVTVKAPGGIYNRSMIRSYFLINLPKFLVRLYGIGA
jgi:hypothetical protein